MVTNTHTEAKKDLRSEKLTSNYSSLWKSDSAKDTDADRDARLEQYTDVVNGESACVASWAEKTLTARRLL